MHKDEFGNPDDLQVRIIKKIVHAAVRILAAMMVVVIILGVIDVAYLLHQKAMAPPRFILTINDILATFGAFIAVLIAIEILVNILLYLRDDVIHVKIVMATALMAIARKVIILDYDTMTPMYLFATAAVVLAMSAGYYMVVKISEDR
ncbi:MAG: phosphate-starvation-inducible PsiE family protein [Spirochaetales bacterium]|nr:phosphate-starvation-inducible PsiE family protein [Spirochaetales bacterium]